MLQSPDGFWTNNTTVKVIEVPIVVLNVDEVAPIITSADVVSIADNTADGATIYTVTSTDDEDISEGVDYSITAGGENFSVNAETGAVTVNSSLKRVNTLSLSKRLIVKITVPIVTAWKHRSILRQ